MMNFINRKRTQVLVSKNVSALVSQLSQYTSETGYISKNDVDFKIPGTKNTAILQVSSRASEATLRVYVVKNGTDMAYSNFIHSCENSQFEQYIKNEIDINEIYDSIMHLSEKCGK